MKIIEKMSLTLLVIGCLGLIVPGLEAAEIKVNCNKGESVQSALDILTGPATIVVKGTCNENVVIKKDDVTIKGGTFVGPDANQNTIQVLSARRVLISGATVGGANHGVRAYQGASLTLENSLIEANAQSGVGASYGSSVTVNGCTIRANTLQGVVVTDNSALVLTNSTVTANGQAGVLVQRSSSARIGQSITGLSGLNTITNNGGPGVNVSRSAYALIDGNTITGNSFNGISIEGASATVTNNTIQGNQRKGIVVSSSGNARIGMTEGDQSGQNIIENNVYEGIEISNSAAAYMLKNQIRFNGLTTNRAGVGIYRATGRLIGDNTIRENGGHGVAVNLGALFQGVGDLNLTAGPDSITGNHYSGISGWNGASLDLRHATIKNNTQNGIVLSLQSTLRIYDSTVSGNSLDGISLYDGSSVAPYSTDSPRDSITGNSGWGIVCNSNSHLVGGTGNSGVSGNSGGQVNCPEFHDPPPPLR
jgi:parallel beta-helix repeat protein